MNCRLFKLFYIVICLLLFGSVYGQDYSNKGTDFWLGYGYHVNMAGNPSGGGTQDMILYLTSDKNAKVTVEIPSVGYSITYNVAANQTTISNPLPKFGAQDARINSPGLLKRGIHITSDVPIVAYSHLYYFQPIPLEKNIIQLTIPNYQMPIILIPSFLLLRPRIIPPLK